MKRLNPIKIVGIDLAGSSSRPTGLCLVCGRKLKTAVVFSDEEIMEQVEKAHPQIVAIDAPLSLPPGRKNIEDRKGGHFRACDLALRKKGIRFFPLTVGPMRMLTERGIKLRKKLEKMGFRVIEIYPGGAQDIWNIPRARISKEGLLTGLRKLARARMGLIFPRGIKPPINLTADELDGITAAFVGLLYLRGQAELYGRGDKVIVMPFPDF